MYESAEIRPEFLKTLKRHTACVPSCTFSTDGKMIVFASHDKTPVLWDMSTFRPTTALKGHYAPLTSTAFSPSSRLLATCSKDGNVRILDTESHRCIVTGEGEAMLVGQAGPVYCCVWSRSCGLAASAGKDRAVRLWDMQDTDNGVGSCLASLEGHAEREFDVAFSTVQEHVLASTSRDQTVRLWDVGRQAETLRLGNHADEVCTCSFSQDEGTLAAGGAGRMFQLMDICSGATTFQAALKEPTLSSAFSDMWTWWEVNCSGRSSAVVDLGTQREVALFDCYDGECTALAFCGTKLVCWDSLVQMYILQINRLNFATPPSPEHQGRPVAF